MRTQATEIKYKARQKTRQQLRKEERAKAFAEREAKRKAILEAKRAARAEKYKSADMQLVEQAARLLEGGTAVSRADETGLCESTIYRFRNGKVYEPRFRTLQLIAKANGGRLVFVRDN